MYDFNELLILFSGLLLLVTVFSFINEKTIKLPFEIGLVVFGFVFVFLIVCGVNVGLLKIPQESLDIIAHFNFNDFLLHGVLCFMLFSGACGIKFRDFNEDKYLIGSMAVLGTIVSTLVYGLLFYVFCLLLKMNISVLEALILGAIVSPTDPISAMSILGKVGLPKRLSMIVEGESLFNDGIAVAIFTTLMGILENTSGTITVMSFISGLLMDILGAVAIAGVISFFCFLVFKYSNNRFLKMFSSILTVMLSYLLCEYFGFSGPIAAVICGLFYASGIYFLEKKGVTEEVKEMHGLFYDFWEVIDNLLNGILFLLVGLLFVDVVKLDLSTILLVGFGAIVVNTIARAAGVVVPGSLAKTLPLEMKKKNFVAFFSWAGLKGGLCLALVMGTATTLKIETYNVFLIATYAIVFFTTLFQGLTIGTAYLKLK
ncbi:MAG: cation:proton antiporter [Eubacteriaceae bacterium]